MPYTYTCQQCGRKFENKNSPGCKYVPKYCHRKCYWDSKCGKQFYDRTGQAPGNKKEPIEIICKICGCLFTVTPARKKSAKYCSYECSHEAKRRITGPTHPLWTRVEMQCEWCGKSVWVKQAKIHEFRFCSKQCHGAYTAKQMAEKNGPTSIEQLLIDELDRRQIVYRTQHQIAKWLIDITLPQHRIAIEADGDYWHSSKEQQEKDANKDRWLRAHKWMIFRFSGSEIRQSPKVCIDKVVSSIRSQAKLYNGT